MLPIGQVIDNKYRIARPIGEGGMGAVYEGENLRINRRVAIKVLHANVADNKEAVQRFEREAQAAGRIGNDHILEVLDLGELPDGQHFMVMEFLDGEPLSARIHRLGRMTAEELCPLMRQVLLGLEAAHGAGIVHRDLKPDNIFVLTEKYGNKDFVKLIDFGVSKFNVLNDDMKMTRTGAVVGTPYYMSPEQASGSQVTDGRSDLYAVGVIMYEAVTGHVPFDAPTFNQLMFQIVLSSPVPATQVVPTLDPAFGTIISKAMSRDPVHRFQSARQVLEALDAWQATRSPVTVPPQGDAYALAARGMGAAAAQSPTAAGEPGWPTANGPVATGGAVGADEIAPYATPQTAGGFRATPQRNTSSTLQSEAPPPVGSMGQTAAGPELALDASRSGGSWASSQLGIVPKSNAPLWVAAAAAVVVVGSIAAWLVFRSPEPAAADVAVEATGHPAAAPVPDTPAGTPTPAPADTAPLVVPSEPPPSAAAEDAGVDAAVKTSSRTFVRPPRRPPPRQPATPKTVSPPAPPPPSLPPPKKPARPPSSSSGPDFGY